MSKTSHGVHRSNIHFRFTFPSFDFVTQWMMGAQTHGASEFGECLYATSRIQNADPTSWVQEWTALAQRVEKRAQAAFQGGHLISARQAYFRAYTYYRAPLVYLNPYTSQDYEAIYEKAKTCFQIAASLCDPVIEPVAIPFNDKILPGYFARASQASAHSPTLIMVGGGDTFVEDLYGYIVPAANVRGYHVLLVDLPGQGILPNRGMPMRPDAEQPMSAVIDYALSRADVDGERLAACGISGGGYLVPRAATRDSRLKAMVANSIILNFADHWVENAGIGKIAKLEHSVLYPALIALRPKRMMTVMDQVQTYYWRWGVRTPEELIEVSRSFTVSPVDLTCPLLIVIGENEYQANSQSQSWIAETCQKSKQPVQVCVAPTDEGANSHATGANLSMMSQIVFDWLDEQFA